MKGRLLYSSSGGVDHYWHANGDGTYTVTAEQRCDAIIDRAKAMATHNDGYSRSRELRRVGTLPNIIRLKWLQEEGWDALDPACEHKLKQKLNDPDWQYLRTAPGRI